MTSSIPKVNSKEIQILDQILLVDLSGIHLWTARKKLKPTMLEGRIPPATLASLGSMRVIDPAELKPFEKIKRRATSLVESKGVKFLGGYAIPDTLIHEIVADLNELKVEFYAAKKDFISRYDFLVNDWINREWDKEEWREAIKASVTPLSAVDQGIQFGFAACRVAPDGDEKLSDLLDGEVRGLADQLYADTASEAEDLLSTGLATRGSVDQRTLNTLRRMNSKLKGLMFLSNDVRSLNSYITDLLDELPTSGVVTGGQYSQVVTLVSSLSDEGSIKRLIKHLKNAAGDDDEQFQFAVPSSQQPEAETSNQRIPVSQVEFDPEDIPESESHGEVEGLAQPPESQQSVSFWF
ncbi:DUF3150 domain-containing protein [Pseudomonas neustonica]|uniref:DUF3150 domain-containing protein n=1 Tax=Pseudomonas neustonica TaxID=2487346 RepID=UPI003F464EB7|tara:strand:- start:8914 stop:9969 length:1056 start_codon:yes stop_codon:yes gene_type:complete